MGFSLKTDHYSLLLLSSRVNKTEDFALGSLLKWPWRCSAALGTGAYAGRRLTPRLWCPVSGMCANAQTATQLNPLSTLRLGAAAKNGGACRRPFCGTTTQSQSSDAGTDDTAGACTMRDSEASPMEDT